VKSALSIIFLSASDKKKKDIKHPFCEGKDPISPQLAGSSVCLSGLERVLSVPGTYKQKAAVICSVTAQVK